MCPPESPYPDNKKDQSATLKGLVGGLAISALALGVSTIALAVNKNSGCDNSPAATIEESAPVDSSPVDSAPKETAVSDPSPAVTTEGEFTFLNRKIGSSFYSDLAANTCAGTKLPLDNKACDELNVPQSGANVTKGYVGNLDVGEIVPNTKAYFQSAMCPVNVHWHLGTEHYSVGEYDEGGDGPHGNQPLPEWANRDLASDEKVRDGFRCHHYDAEDPKFTTPYNWQHCEGMEVGETYEVHWPHSAAGACGTVNQYQSPFYDGVFCNLDMEAFQNIVATAGAQGIASAVGVHGQVFTIVNDDSYYYGDMMRGMIIDGDMGKDIAYYTGSTTGTSRDNTMCSSYAPITWQVDRKCHMISASSFDKLCYDMKMQRDDMSSDLHAHGSRELVHHDFVGNNQHYPGDRKFLRA